MNSASSAVENGIKVTPEEKGDVQPGEVTIAASEPVELSLLSEPEDAEG
jgi:hypothetical protein